MNDTLTKALVAAGGVILGAVVTALASAYSARQKIKEIELTYQQKLKENYLANARQYTNAVYVPISIELGKLSDQYQNLRKEIDPKTRAVNAERHKQFEQACSEYDKQISNLLERGADAFLTTEFEERLRSFNSFLRASLAAAKPIVRIVMHYSLRLPGMASISTEHSVASQVEGKLARSLYGQGISFDFWGIGFAYQARELLAAPTTSKEFEGRISEDIPALKFLIKEVTLGAHAK